MTPAFPLPFPAIIEQIAQQWDGCKYEASGGDIDIGEAIRSAAKRIAGVTATGPTKEDELRQALQMANDNAAEWKRRASSGQRPSLPPTSPGF